MALKHWDLNFKAVIKKCQGCQAHLEPRCVRLWIPRSIIVFKKLLHPQYSAVQYTGLQEKSVNYEKMSNKILKSKTHCTETIIWLTKLIIVTNFKEQSRYIIKKMYMFVNCIVNLQDKL